MSGSSPAFSPADKIIVVTGGASGIGRALARRFAREGARGVIVVDLDAAAAQAVADGLAANTGTTLAIGLDVTDAVAVAEAVDRIENEIGPIDLWCSNAGLGLGTVLGTDGDWDLSWRVHVMAHVYASRTVLPRMERRGRGHLLITASAAGLLTNMDTAPYSVTKHGSVALAEWLAIRYADAGLGVSCLCPQGVHTPMTAGSRRTSATRAAGAFIEPEDVAEAVVTALAEGRFLILPHPEVADYERRRADDRDRWLTGMRRVRARQATGS